MAARAVTVRALMPEDGEAVRALVTRALKGTRYLARWLEVIESVLAFDDPEYMALVASCGDELCGVAAFGAVSGADRVVKLHGVVVRDADEPAVMGAMLDAVTRTCEPSLERMIVCELPGDVVFDSTRAALVAARYVEEGCVPDLVAPAVPMLLLVRRL